MYGKTSAEKKTFSFGHCPNHLNPPPPPDPNSGNLVLFFGRQKRRFVIVIVIVIGGCSVAAEVQWPQKPVGWKCVNDDDEDLLSPVKQSNGDCLKVAAPQVESRLRIFIGPRCPWGPIYGSGCLSLTH